MASNYQSLSLSRQISRKRHKSRQISRCMGWLSSIFGRFRRSRKVAPDSFKEFIMDTIKMDVPEALKSIVENPSNTTCVDCGSSDTTWASLGFGTLICLKCAGFHRSLGTHITSVRAIQLDSWSPDQVTILNVGGNANFLDYCSRLELEADVILTMAKYGNPRVLYYSAILRAQLGNVPIPPYNEEDWTSTASYALQASSNFVTNVQETSLSAHGSTTGSSPTSNGSGMLSPGESSPKRSSPTPPAKWTPDSAVAACMECNTAFTFLFRRHHCRRCGRTVCRHCAPANNDRPIPEWGFPNPVRHCKKCYRSPAVDWKS